MGEEERAFLQAVCQLTRNRNHPRSVAEIARLAGISLPLARQVVRNLVKMPYIIVGEQDIVTLAPEGARWCAQKRGG
jgi:Mn-dependent DtxR family transcriptional regulator